MEEEEIRRLDSPVGEVIAVFCEDFSVDLGGFPKGTDLWLWFLESPVNEARWCFGVSDDFDEEHPAAIMNSLSSIEWLQKIAIYKGTLPKNFGCPHCEAISHYEMVEQMAKSTHEMMMASTEEELAEYRKAGDFQAWEQIHALPNGLPKQSMN